MMTPFPVLQQMWHYFCTNSWITYYLTSNFPYCLDIKHYVCLIYEPVAVWVLVYNRADTEWLLPDALFDEVDIYIQSIFIDCICI